MSDYTYEGPRYTEREFTLGKHAEPHDVDGCDSPDCQACNGLSQHGGARKGAGRKRNMLVARCCCGLMTLKRACARYHKCGGKT